MTVYAHVTGWGMAVPEKILTNDAIAEMVDTSDEWIRTRTGVRERRIANDDETTASLAGKAALKALAKAQLKPTDLDLIIVSTSSPEYLFPSTASIVQNAIGANNAAAFDLSAACTGFIYAVDMAANSIKAGGKRNALVIGSETLSRIVNWKDRGTCILFGDGAGAFVLQGSSESGGILSSYLRSDGSGADLLVIPAGGSKHPATVESVQQDLHFIQMKGTEVFRFATRVMSRATKEVIARSKLTINDVSLVVPHQANIRIIEAAAKGLKLPKERFVINIGRYGNTSTASIPIAVTEAFDEGRIQSGDNIVLVGFGAGLTWGAISLTWTGPLPERPQINIRQYQLVGRVRGFFMRWIRRVEGWLHRWTRRY